MAKIFISGVAGFLGSHLADRMLELGHEVVGVDDLSGGYNENVNPGVKFSALDCIHQPRMETIMCRCDVVFHCACSPWQNFSFVSPYRITKDTYQITMSVLSAAIASEVKRFVFLSSMARYGVQEKSPYTEDMVCRPQDPYAIAKYAAELSIQNLSQVYGFEYVIAVPHSIIGPRQKYDSPYGNVAAIMINLMLQGRQPIIYGDGEYKRCFSFIQDDIYCLEKLAFQDNVAGEIINIGPDEEEVTINQLAQTIAEIIGFDLKPVYLPERPMEVQVATCSADKARKLLGYKTRYTLKQGLSEMVNYIRARGPKSFQYYLFREIKDQRIPVVWRNDGKKRIL